MKLLNQFKTLLLLGFGVIAFSSCLDSDNDDNYWNDNFLDRLNGRWKVDLSVAQPAEESENPESAAWYYVFDKNHNDYKFTYGKSAHPGMRGELVQHVISSYSPLNGGLFGWRLYSYDKDYQAANESGSSVFNHRILRFTGDQLQLREFDFDSQGYDYTLIREDLKADLGSIEGTWEEVKAVPTENEPTVNTSYSFLENNLGKKTISEQMGEEVKQDVKDFYYYYNNKLGILEIYFDKKEITPIKDRVSEAYIIVALQDGLLKLQGNLSQKSLKKVIENKE
ncbi:MULTISPECIES: hypothetical protein [Bacteroides]|uniref:hypothetical protein n=1 Tax=Bacteroides TaxID=816 RepID=UPI001DC67E62|nr:MULTISPECIES: hypothetical protein [Bacteroides]HJD92512.1 hypothetical protein [Bacteroides coprosuis]